MLAFKAGDAQGLLTAVYTAITRKQIETWSYDDVGDLTHTPPQWRLGAWLRPIVKSGVLEFGIIRRNDRVLSREIYAIYHGRFNEMMLAHFDSLFTSSQTTALLTAPPDLY